MKVYIVRVCQREEINGKSKTSRVLKRVYNQPARQRKLDCRKYERKCVRANRQSVTANNTRASRIIGKSNGKEASKVK